MSLASLTPSPSPSPSPPALNSAGDLAQPVVYNGRPLYYRGYRNLRATLEYLLTMASPSLSAATHVLVSGSSAGGLTTYLHIDAIAEAVHAVNPGAVVKALPEVGFFIDGASIWSGAHLMTDVYSRIAVFANVTGGAPEQVNAACVAAYPPSERWKCFMAQYTYPFITTPTFILNS